jgi:hypothetical protein
MPHIFTPKIALKFTLPPFMEILRPSPKFNKLNRLQIKAMIPKKDLGSSPASTMSQLCEWSRVLYFTFPACQRDKMTSYTGVKSRLGRGRQEEEGEERRKKERERQRERFAPQLATHQSWDSQADFSVPLFPHLHNGTHNPNLVG